MYDFPKQSLYCLLTKGPPVLFAALKVRKISRGLGSTWVLRNPQRLAAVHLAGVISSAVAATPPKRTPVCGATLVFFRIINSLLRTAAPHRRFSALLPTTRGWPRVHIHAARPRSAAHPHGETTHGESRDSHVNSNSRWPH